MTEADEAAMRLSGKARCPECGCDQLVRPIMFQTWDEYRRLEEAPFVFEAHQRPPFYAVVDPNAPRVSAITSVTRTAPRAVECPGSGRRVTLL